MIAARFQPILGTGWTVVDTQQGREVCRVSTTSAGPAEHRARALALILNDNADRYDDERRAPEAESEGEQQ